MVLIKFKEWITAVKLEHNYSKDEIIAMYFNTVPFGYQTYGVKLASKTFFDQTPDSLKIEEAALLVGMLQAPSFYNPVRNTERAFNRRNTVLNQMKKYEYITEQQFDSLKAIPIDMSNYKAPDRASGYATYLREYLRQELKKWCNEHLKPDGKPYDLYKDGLKIYTTVNSRMQKYAEEAVAEHLGNDLQPAFFKHWKDHKNAPFYFQNNAEEEINNLMTSAMKRSDRYRRLKDSGMAERDIKKNFRIPVGMKVFSWKGEIDTTMTPWDSIRYYKFFLQASLMSVEPSTGYVLAYVGGIDYRHFQYDHVISGRRQVGSTFKPFLYTLAMQEGMTPCTKIPNIQPIIELSDGRTWRPNNSQSDYAGQEITLKYALATSNNWISGHLIKRFSPQSVVQIARKMGITSPLDPVPSIVLGSSDVSLYEMTGAMNTFASQGVFVKPIIITRIEDKQGNVLEAFVPEMQEAMSEETAYLMLELMKGVVRYGTGARLRGRYQLPYAIAGKTGTTNNHSDGWFMGITPDITTGIWVGCEDRAAHFRSLSLGQGANMALPIWGLYMQKIYADPVLNISKGDFDPPSKPLTINLDCDQEMKSEEFDNVVIDEDEF